MRHILMLKKSEDEWQGFINIIKQAVNDDYLDNVMYLLLTSDERQALATRVRIIQELMRGKLTQRELKDELRTGIATITRGSNSLKIASSEFKRWLAEQLLSADEYPMLD